MNYEQEIKECVVYSFEDPGNLNSDNLMLRDDREWQEELDLIYHPTVTINDYTYRGSITYDDIVDALCEAFDMRLEECSEMKLEVLTVNNDNDKRSVEKAIILACIIVVFVISIMCVLIMSHR